MKCEVSDEALHFMDTQVALIEQCAMEIWWNVDGDLDLSGIRHNLDVMVAAAKRMEKAASEAME